jgi:putative two-component system response regulator
MSTILVVDDFADNCRMIAAVLAVDAHDVRIALNGAEAVSAVRDFAPDLILMDVVMPTVDGIEACRAIKQDPRTRLIPVVLLTGLNDGTTRMRGIEAGADDFIEKPFNILELRARVRSLLRLKSYTDDLDHADSVIISLALTVEARDSGTGDHCQRLSTYATALGRKIGLGLEDLATLDRGAYLHDIGKIGIPDTVLLKRGALAAEERALVEQHPVIGDRLCGELRSLRRVRPIVRHHHERLDGSGYPDGLRGDNIPLLARVVGIVDVFDALMTERPYKAALPFERAAEMLREEAARGWRSTDLVDVFLGLVEGDRMQARADVARELPRTFHKFLKAGNEPSHPVRLANRAS